MNLTEAFRTNPTLSQLINLLNFGVTIFDKELKLIICNQKYLSLLDFPEELSMPGTPIERYFEFNAQRGEYQNEDYEEAVAKRVYLAKKRLTHSFERERPNGDIILVQGAPIPGEGFISTYFDITESRKKIKELQKITERSLATLKSSVDSLPHGISMFDRDLVLQVCNDAFLKTLNFPKELGETGTTFEDMIRYNIARGEYGEGDPEEILKANVERAKKFEPHKFIRERPDGTSVEIIGKPIENGFVTTYRDITTEQNTLKSLENDKEILSNEVKITNENYLKTSSLLKLVLDTIPVRVFWKDKEGVYQGSNLGYLNDRNFSSIDELIGKTDFDMFNDELANKFIQQDQDIISGKTTSLNLEEEVMDSNGRISWIKTQKIALRNHDNQLLGILGTYEDITYRVQTEMEIKELNQSLEHRVEERTQELQRSTHELEHTLRTLKVTQQELVESEKMASLGGLVSGVAHEVNTPIGISVTAASLLQDQLCDIREKMTSGNLKKSDLDNFFESAEENVTITLNNLNRAAQLIGSFKKVATDQTSQEKQTIDFKNYLEEVILNISPELKKKHISLNLELPRHISLFIDPGAIAQIFTNLIFNSMTHAFENQEHRVIEITAEKSDEELIILYNDNGKGMPPHVVSQIFEPFFTTQRGSGGSGLGMNIVYNLVKQSLKGQIKCISSEGKGTQFIITLPIN